MRRRRLLRLRRSRRSRTSSMPRRRAARSRASTATRSNRATSSRRPNTSEKLRFNWNTPIARQPERKGTIYIGAQFLFRSRDHGQTWERISPDLTTNDPEKQKQEESGGITVDNSAAETHTTIYSISASRRATPGLIWVGTDDGNIQLTRDGGKTWTNVDSNVPGVPEGSWVSWVEASRFDPGPRTLPFDRHTFGDIEPYVYRTTRLRQDLDAHRLAEPQGVRGYAHVIKEDTKSAGTCSSSGTEFGLWISIDNGAPLGAIQGRRPAQRARARLRNPAARFGSRAGHARPRHLDRRRHHAAASSQRERHEQRLRLPARAPGATAHPRQRRLARR